MRILGCWVILCLLVAGVVSAEDDGDIYDRSYLVIDNSISSYAKVDRLGPQSDLEFIKTILFFHPIADQRLEVQSMETTPKAKQENQTLIFLWSGNATKEIEYLVKSRVKTKTIYDLIPEKVSFPLSGVPSDVTDYLSQTESVDYADPYLRKKANDLAEGEDDLYILTNKIGMWIQENIAYNLSTVTADASQKASWVMKNRYGVCDEITNLFLAMVRSLGIPARFISGVAYTNSPMFSQKWGPHGWAEVYFPKFGWIPFDITYQQYGWLDPSHLKLREALDATDPATRFEWRGRDVEVKASPLKTTAEIVEKGPKINYELEIIPSVLNKAVGIGSYNLVNAHIINYNNFYKTTDVALARTEGVEILGKQSQMVILKPYEQAKVSWLIRTDPALNEEFSYTFPLMVYTQRNITGSAEFSAKRGETIFSKDSVAQLKTQGEPKDEKAFTSQVELSCAPLLSTMRTSEHNVINCSIINKGNTVLEDLNVCYKSQCQRLSLLIGEEKTSEFLVQDIVPGKNMEAITAKSGGSTASAIIGIFVLDQARLSITNITAPSKVRYEDEFALEFTLKKESVADPVDITVTLQDGIYEQFYIAKLEKNQRVVLKTSGSLLNAGENTIVIDVLYHDQDFKRYTESKSINLLLEKPTFFQRIMILLNRFGQWISRFWDLHQELVQEES